MKNIQDMPAQAQDNLLIIAAYGQQPPYSRVVLLCSGTDVIALCVGDSPYDFFSGGYRDGTGLPKYAPLTGETTPENLIEADPAVIGWLTTQDLVPFGMYIYLGSRVSVGGAAYPSTVYDMWGRVPLDLARIETLAPHWVEAPPAPEKPARRARPLFVQGTEDDDPEE